MNKYTYSQQILSDKIFDFIYKVSMRDAILRGAFKGDRKDIGGFEEPKNILRNLYIKQLLESGFANQTEHDDVFLNVANMICAEINKFRDTDKTGEFCFGNAQKLINITVKHCYAFCYHDQNLRERFRHCHCPMDSIMLGKVWEKCDANERKSNLGTKKFFLDAWGKEGCDEKGNQIVLSEIPKRYKKFQEAIKDIVKKDNGDVFPIEFDYLVWNEDDANSGAGEE